MVSHIVSPDPVYCEKCKQWKQPSEFYRRSGAKHLVLATCKACRKKMSAEQTQLPRMVAGNQAETLVIERMARFGIPALPGKALSVHRTDIIAWGSIPVEVKSSTLYDERGGRGFKFGFTPKQHKERVLGDFVVLICQYDDRNTFHVMPGNHACFYLMTGKHKQQLEYVPNRTRAIRQKQRNVLTRDIMDEHEDAWHLIEERRLEVVAELRAG